MFDLAFLEHVDKAVARSIECSGFLEHVLEIGPAGHNFPDHWQKATCQRPRCGFIAYFAPAELFEPAK